MTFTIAPYDHHCTEAGDCGESVDNPDNIAKRVRKYVILKDGVRIRTRAFHTHEEAAERVRRMGFEVDE